MTLFFDNWETLYRTAVVGVLAYICLVCFLRISGRRTLSKMNAFDMVVTVSLGSTLATILLNKDVALAEGALAFALLIGMQYAVTWSSVRAPWFRKVVTGEPALLVHRGTYIRKAMRRARVTEDEVRAALRSSSVDTIEAAHAVVLETDGSFSVLREAPDEPSKQQSSLKGVAVPGSGEPKV